MIRNIYVCSAGHSGSTLLDMLLGSHSRAESVGELVHLPMDMKLNNACACGSPIQGCPVWSQVMQRMRVNPEIDPYALDLGYALPKVGDPQRTGWLHSATTRPKLAIKYYEYRLGLPFLGMLTPGFGRGIENTLKVYEHLRAMTGKEVIVDSTKHYLRAVALYQARPDIARVVVLVRDGRGVFYSGLKRGFDRKVALRAWHRHYLRTRALLDRYVPEHHRALVRYEDLVTNPEATVRRLCDFLGMDFEEGMLDFRGVVHHNVNGNDMKYLATSELRLDEAWKSKLGAADARFFEKHAGSLNRAFGYV